jgi:hypothetical protein
MRIASAVLVFLIAAGCAESPPTYEQVVGSMEQSPDVAIVKEWSAATLSPFLDANVQVIIVPCAALVSEGASTTARFLVEAQAAPGHVRIHDEAPSAFSACLKGRMQALNWPRAPGELRYIPVEISAHQPAHAGDRNADDAITIL